MNKPFWIGSCFLLILLFFSTVGPTLPMIDQELKEKRFYYGENREIVRAPYPSSEENLIGTDHRGRDLFSLLVVGTQQTMLIVLYVTLLRYLLAVPLGIISSLRPSQLMDNIINSLNRFFNGLPTLFATILIVSLPFVSNSDNRAIYIVLIIAFIDVGRVAYIFQQETNRISKLPYIESGIMVGNGLWRLFYFYYWRNLLPQVIVNFVVDIGRVMILMGQLAFFSIFITQKWVLYEVGIRVLENTSINWLILLSETRHLIRSSVWVPFLITFAIAFFVITFNLLGEGLRQYFETKTSSKYNPRLERKTIKEMLQKKEQSNGKGYSIQQ